MRKGFTLIELLAVIIILAIISIIAVPIFSNMIYSGRKKAAIAESYTFIEEVNAKILDEDYEYDYDELNGGFHYKENEFFNAFNLPLELKGTKPTNALVLVSKSKVKQGYMCIDGFAIEYNNNISEIINNNCGGLDDTLPALVLNAIVNTNSIDININAHDEESEIVKITCEWGRTNKYGTNVNVEDNHCIINNLAPNEQIFYRVTVLNKAGFKTVEVGKIKTKDFGSIDIEHTTGWTNSREIVINAPESSSQEQLQYKLFVTSNSNSNVNEWTNIDNGGKITLVDKATASEPIYLTIRLTDGINESETFNYTETLIDIDNPVLKDMTATSTFSSFTVDAKVQDSLSGISKIDWYYKRCDTSTYTKVTTTYDESVTAETTKSFTPAACLPYGTYDYYADIYDEAGNMITTSVKEISLQVPNASQVSYSGHDCTTVKCALDALYGKLK